MKVLHPCRSWERLLAVVFLLRLLAPAAAQPPGADESAGAKKAREALQKVYTLADGEDLKCVRPPFPAERKTYELAAFAITEGLLDKNVKIEIWEWDGDRLRNAWSVSRADGEDHPLFDVVAQLTHLRDCEIEGEGVADLQGLKTKADFIVRGGLSQDKMIDALNGVLRRDFKARVKLRLRTVEREVVVVSGTYHAEAPLGDGQRTPLQLYGKFPIGEGKGEKFMGGFSGLLDRIGVLSARQIVSEVKEPPEGNPVWCEYDPTFRLDTEEDATALLKHVMEQTGLMFKREKRSVKVLFVDSTE